MKNFGLVVVLGLLVGGKVEASFLADLAVIDSCAEVNVKMVRSVCVGHVNGQDYVFLKPQSGKTQAMQVTSTGALPTFVPLAAGESLMGLEIQKSGEIDSAGQFNRVNSSVRAQGSMHAVDGAVQSLDLVFEDGQEIRAENFLSVQH